MNTTKHAPMFPIVPSTRNVGHWRVLMRKTTASGVGYYVVLTELPSKEACETWLKEYRQKNSV